MAEIKRYQGRSVTNQAIGVVTPSRAGVESAQALERLGTQMFEMAYREGVKEQTALGEKTGQQLKFQLRDEQGNLQVARLPEGLSPVAERNAQAVLDKRYINALNIDMRDAAVRIRADNKDDPDGFDESYSKYVATTIKEAGAYGAQAEQIGATYASQHTAALYAEKLEAEDKRDFQLQFESIRQEIDEIGTLVIDPDELGVSSASSIEGRFNDLVRTNGIIDQLQDEHGKRLGITQITELKRLARSSYYGGKTSKMMNDLTKLANEQNPFASASIVSTNLNYMISALQAGSTDQLPDSVKANLSVIGFDNEFLQQDDMSSIRGTLASKVAVFQGNQQELFNAQQAERQMSLISRTVEAGGLLGQNDADFMFKTVGIEDAYGLANQLSAILGNPDNVNIKPLYDVLMGNGALPKPAVDLLSDVGTIRDIVTNDPSMLPVLQNFYKQATTVNRGGFATTSHRGMDEKVTVFWDTIDAYSNSVRTMSVDEFFARKTEFDNMPSDIKTNKLKSELKSAGYEEGGLREFVLAKTGFENAEQEYFFMSYADELIMMHGVDKAGKILKSSGDRVFKKSKLTYGNDKSRYAPEIAYDDAEMQVFQDAVYDQILRVSNGDMVLGENVFLVADPREGSVFPVYTLVDENKVPLMAGSEPLQVGATSVLAARQANRNKTINQLRAEARAERERYLKTMKGVDNAVDNSASTPIADITLDGSDFN